MAERRPGSQPPPAAGPSFDRDDDEEEETAFDKGSSPGATRRWTPGTGAPGRIAQPMATPPPQEEVKTTIGPPPNPPPSTPVASTSTAIAPRAPTGPIVPGGADVSIYKLDRSTSIDTRLVMVREPDSERAAAYRVLRHRLLERDRRTFVVTSARPGEGKTTCAANLALALGECGRARVLLVEANLRTPALAAMLGFAPPVCFADQLISHRDRPLDPWTLVEVLSPFLHVAAVKPSSAGRPLVDAPAFAIAMERLKLAGYDYIVIDTPSVLGAADVNLIQDSADAVFFVARARDSSSRHLRRAVEQLAPAPILGVVMLE